MARTRMLDDLRQTFASGQLTAGEALLASLLDAGLPWDDATRAVAEGIAQRFRDQHRGVTTRSGNKRWV